MRTLGEWEEENGGPAGITRTQADPQVTWGQRLGSGLDNAQAQMFGLGEAVADTMGIDSTNLMHRRLANTAEAQGTNQLFAEQRGVPGSLSETDWTSPRQVGLSLGTMAADTLPQTGAIIGASLINPGLGLATAYGSAAGDIIQNQRERTGGAADLGSSLALAAPYAALEFVPGGVEAAAAARTLPRAGIKALDDLTGVRGYAARAGAAALKEGASGAATETGQEFTNVLGQRSVDPTQELFGVNEMDRYRESAIGGALLEATMGAPTGGMRSEHYRPADRPSIDQQGGKQLVGTPPDQTAPGSGAGLTPDMLGQPAGAMPGAPPGTANTAPVVTPQTMGQPQGSPPAAPAPPPSPEEVIKRQQQESDQKLAQSIKDTRSRLDIQDDGSNVLGTKFNVGRVLKLGKTLTDVDTMLADGVIEEDQHRMAVSMLKQGLEGEVKNEIKQWRLEDAEAKQVAGKAQPVAGAAQGAGPSPTPATAAASAPAAVGGAAAVPQGPAAGAVQPVAASGAALPAAPVQLTSTAAAPEARAAVGAAIQTAAATGQTQGQKVVAALETKGGKPLDERQRQRIYSALGFDTNGEPTGLPRRTWDQVARVEADRAGGKPMTEDAIRKDLKKAGVDVTMLDQIADALDARHQQEVSTLSGKGELVEEDVGDRTATMGQDEVADATEAGAYSKRKTDTNLRETTDISSHAGEEQGYFSRASDALADLSNPEVSGERLNPDQIAAMGQLKTMADSLRANPDLTPDMRRDALLAAANNTMKDRALWPDDELHKVVSNQLAHGKTRAAEARKEAVVREAAEAEKVDPELVAANEAQVAKNLADKQLRESNAELLQQWREQQAMTAEGRAEALAEELGRTPEARDSIDDAREEWTNLMEPGDETELGFDDLDADLQAAWVRYVHTLYTTKDEATYNTLMGRRVARMGEVMTDAQRRGNTRNRYGNETTAPRVLGEGGQAAGGTAETTDGAGQEAAAEPRAVQGAEGGTAAQGLQEAPDGDAARPGASNDEAGEQRGTGTLENIERITMTGAAPVGTQTVTGRQRAPSLKRAVRRARDLLDEGVIGADQFAAQSSAALDAADQAERRQNVPRQRGALLLREKLLAAQRRGELSADMVEFADWLLRQNPQWATDLGLSLKAPTDENQGTAGFYTPVSRILTLIKGRNGGATAVHEILHHIERMMPTPMQNAIRREWARQLARAHRKAAKGANEDLKQYYQHLMDYHYGEGGFASRKAAMDMLKNGKVPYEVYQHFNPSEFWAINGTDIMEARYGVSESILGRMRQWLSELVQRIKSAFGLNSNASIVNALNSLAQSDGQYRTGTMISGLDDAHFMYAGRNTMDQERKAQFDAFEQMNDFGFDAKTTRAATGWWVGEDSKPRYEFSDHKATWKTLPADTITYDSHGTNDERTAATYRLGDVVNHTELFKAYPDAANIKVRFENAPNGNERGSYYKDTITVNKGLAGRSDADVLSTMLHETQHWVQDKEGFSPGSNTRNVASQLPDDIFERERDKALTWMADRAMKAVTKANLFDAVMADPRTQQVFDMYDRLLALRGVYTTEANRERLAVEDQIRQLADQITKDAGSTETGLGSVNQHLRVLISGPDGFKRHFSGERAQADRDVAAAKVLKRGTRAEAERHVQTYLTASGNAYDLYRAVLGEAEARDTQRRQAMTPEERAATPPLEATVLNDMLGTAQESVFVPTNTPVQGSMSDEQEPGFQNIERITQGMPAPARTTAYKAHDLAVGLAKGRVAPWLQAARFTRDIVRSAGKALPSAKAYVAMMDALTARRLHNQREVARIVDDFKKLPQNERDQANKFMHDSTLSDKWGFVPSWIDGFKAESVDPAMAARFQALSPQAQGTVREMFKHSFDSLAAMRAAVERKAQSAFGTDEKGKQKFLDRYTKLLRIHENKPYLPLKRFGDWVVAAKSPEYLAAEEAGDKATLDKLQLDGAHYRVSFRETRSEAEALKREWSPIFGTGLDVVNRDAGYADAFGSGVQTLGLISRIRNTVDDAEISAQAVKTMNKLLTDFELSLMSETSVRQSERRRKGISGADEDMARSFGTKGMAEANFIAGLEAGGAAEDALAAMKREANATGTVAGVSREVRGRYFNELSKRHYMGFDYKPSPVAEGILRASSIWQLTFSPAYHLINALQPLTISAPWLAGKHGMIRTMGAFREAYTALAPNITSIAKAIERNDYSGLPADVQDVVRDLVNRGAISADMIFEHGRRQWKTDDPANLPAKVLRKTNDFMDNVGATVELTNRITTAMAAYRLAKRDGQSEANARDGAYRAIYETHGDYSGFNAPRMMRHPVARVITQYRKFQFIQLGLWGRLMRDSFMNSDLTADEKRVARKQLAFSLATMQAVGGMMALPGAQAIGAILKGIFGDDDEPYSEPTEMKLRRIIGDSLVADMLLKGLPAAVGLDISGKVGAGTILSPLPYAEIPHDRDTYTKALTAALGPFIGGLLPKGVDGVSQMWQGNFLKGIENLAPNGLGNAVKGARFAFEGVTTGKGDLAMSAEDVSLFDAAMTATGFTTGKIADRQLIQETKYEVDQFYKDRTGSIKRDYIKAYRDGDADAMQEARQDWAQVQAARKNRGYTPSPLSDLLKAPAQQVKKERSAIGGVIPGGKRDAGALQQLQELTE